MTGFTREQLDRARAFGAATLHEAAGRVGALPSAIKPVSSTFRLAGPAFTVHCAAVDNLWLHRAIYKAKPGDVLVVCTSGGVEAGYWGDILNAAAKARGLGGLVIDGGVRDTAQLAGDDFPVFSNGVCIRGTGKDFGATGWLNAPIRIGEVVIRSNDLIVGDRDGVVSLSSASVADALDAAERREADEREKIARLEGGERSIDLYGFGDGAG